MLILVVLSLLILFVVIAVMFVLVATRARAVSRSYAEFNRTGDTPQEIVHGIAMDIIRGSINPHSPFRTTSLLEDIYGHVTVRGIVTTQPTVLSGGMVDILAINFPTTPRNPAFSLVKDAYSGCVLTFISGPARGLSARILEYWPQGTLATVNGHKFRIFPLRSEYGQDQIDAIENSINKNGYFVINGRPFSGTGVGYNTAATTGGRVNAVDANSRPYALLPNPTHFLSNNALYGPDPAGPGGAHEGYDAPDYQNPFLAYFSTPNPANWRAIKPSFHDPALLAYWNQQQGGLSDPTLTRQVLFRPNPIDHPIFNTSTNPQIYQNMLSGNFTAGPWDIDNDGDAVADSVWIDPGYPVQVTAQGRLYKPLVAALVLDLDGRLNVNAHGSLLGLPSGGASQMPNQATSTAGLLAGGQPYPNPPRGAGFGPAEIRLENVLRQSAMTVIQERYGVDRLPGMPNIPDPFSIIKHLGVPGQWPPPPANPQISPFGTPMDLRGRLAVALDPHGQPVWDKLADASGNSWSNELVDLPYEINLALYGARGLPASGNGTPADSPFSIGEMELLLRPNDIDSNTLPVRLAQALGQDAARRNELTVDSWDPPVPNMLAGVGGMRNYLAGANVPGRMTSLADLVDARLIANNITQSQDRARAIDALLSPDVRRGLRMDVNRPFGDGLDNGGAPGVVDDAYESTDVLDYSRPPFNGPNNVPLDPVNNDLNGDGQRTANERYPYDSRQLLARNLYVLMMLCSDDNFVFPLSVIPGVPATPVQAPAWGGAQESLDPATHQRELKAKRLAQWAINAVDFRDADNIMTPFPFDTNPFNGWDPTGAERGLVWGCEMPVAVLTETLAFHDRRVRDTDHDDNTGTTRADMMNPDATLDQAQIPRGSAFVEIMAIFDPNVKVQSSDLFFYDQTRNKWLLDLGKPAPDGKPVWRLAVTEFHTEDATDQGKEPVSDIVSEHPDTVSLQPSVDGETLAGTPWNFSLLNQPLDTHDVKIERIVSLSNTPPAGADADRTFYPESAISARLEGFQYAVVGPGGAGAGQRTNAMLQGIPVGWNENNDPATTQRIRLEPNVTFNGTANPSPTNIKPAIGIPVASPPGSVQSNAGAWAANDRVGFSISEPLFSDAAHYYPKPLVANVETQLNEDYGVEGDDNQKFRDVPLDGEVGMPLQERQMTETGTYTNVRTVFLQRLADPTQQYNAQTNPYITVDWMPFDLTVFNGSARHDPASMVPEDLWDSDDPSPNSDTNTKIKFATRERGNKSTAGGVNTEYNVWTPVSEEPEDTEPTRPADNYFRHALKHSLGYLNSSYGSPTNPGGPSGAAFLGAPAQPFPWIRWANRPFVSALELMEVPASTPGRLLLEFNYNVPGGGQMASTSPYDTSPDPNPFKRPFNHLLNFFRATDATGAAGNQPGGDFYRLFEFVHVPSPFAGTETFLDPAVFQTSATSAAGTENFRAPFNWVSNYRDPGKVNLNTINSPDVWRAIKGVMSTGGQEPGLSYNNFLGSRRGIQSFNPTAAQPVTTPVANTPTMMPNPFRSGAAGDMVPDLPGSNPGRLKRDGVQRTLLRAAVAGNGNAAGPPLFANAPMTQSQQAIYANTNRNAAFRYAPLERLANLTTTRSNVYAIWVTVGYFEVFPNPGGVDEGHLDGYQIGAEIGADTGEIERHRGFYILDRSIPVGFERGFNHNVERAIILKRFIE